MRVVQRFLLILLTLILVLRSSTVAAEDPYPNAPNIFFDLSKSTATDIVTSFQKRAAEIGRVSAADESSKKLNRQTPTLVLLTVIHALKPAALDGLLPQSSIGQAGQAETARTDKQVTSPSISPAASSVVDKPSFASLIALALENGVAKSSSNANTLTLSATPYAFIKIFEPDTTRNYYDYRIARQLGASITFNLNDTKDVNNVAIDTDAVSTVGVRLQPIIGPFGDRSSRGTKFRQEWERNVQPLYQEYVNARFQTLKSAYDEQPALRNKQKTVFSKAVDAVQNEALLKEELSKAEKIERIQEIMLGTLYREVYLPAKNTDDFIVNKNQYVDKLELEVFPRLRRAATNVDAKAKKALDKVIESVNKQPILSFTANTQFADGADDSDYTQFNVALEFTGQPFRAANLFSLTLNGDVSLFHQPSKTQDDKTIRSYSLKMALEVSFDKWKGFDFGDSDRSKTTFSVEGSFERLQEQEKNRGVVQGRLTIPIAKGFSIPISIAYHTRQEMGDKDEVLGNIGISWDIDKLHALLIGTEK